MGSDSLENLLKWKNADFIIKSYPIYVYIRPGFSVMPIPGATIHQLEAPLLQISATHIRELVRTGKSIRYLVPDAVMLEIQRNHYYR
jgi:nicotinate-nucleotide adenylyltransferase